MKLVATGAGGLVGVQGTAEQARCATTGSGAAGLARGRLQALFAKHQRSLGLDPQEAFDPRRAARSTARRPG